MERETQTKMDIAQQLSVSLCFSRSLKSIKLSKADKFNTS